MAFWLQNRERQVQYLAVSKLGEGGFGSVWKGQTWDGGLDVAIKVIKPTANPERDLSSWLSDQHVHLLCLGHPHIVTTFDQFVSPEGYLVIVMELGSYSLDALLSRRAKLSAKDICALGWQLLSALGQLHAKGVIHRDITLKNIIGFPGGICKLCDFGVSKHSVAVGDFARTFVGNPAYIPPELLAYGYSTQRSDIYQLGLVLLSLLIGQHPIPTQASPSRVQQLILTGVPRQTAELLIPAHGETARILTRMLPRHDYNRYQTAAQAEAAFVSEFHRLESLERFRHQFPLLNQQIGSR